MNEQENLRVVYQGIPGSYSEASLLEFANTYGITISPLEEQDFFEGLFESIVHSTGIGWVPVSNSHAGTVHQAIDMFLKYDVEIIAEYYFRVDHMLAVIPGTKIQDIATAYSHTQALSQCSEFLRNHHIPTLAYHDTAGAAKMVSEMGDKTRAAVCSKRAAEMYGLEIVAEQIQNENNNTTRFLLVKRKDEHFNFENIIEDSNDEKYKTTVIFAAKEEAGSLYQCISGFAGAGINMSKLESRRSKDGSYDYLFYLDYNRKLDDPASLGALVVLREHSDLVRVLGSYPVHSSS
ncbi:MAG: prephenate dehydratase [Patescibacteria group bacterium]